MSEDRTRRDRLSQTSVLIVLLVVAVIVRLPSLGQPLVETVHGFRETQTAYSAVLYAKDGIDLLHPHLPVLGPPFEVPFEFPLFQAVAAVPLALGLPADPTLRTLGLASFLLTALLLWLLLRRMASETVATWAVVVLLFSPFSLLWSRSAMIEYLATAGALAWVLGLIEWSKGGGTRWWYLSVLGGLVGMSVKVTTAVFWMLPAILIAAPGSGGGLRGLVRRRLDLRYVLALAMPLIAAIVWTGYADGIKAASEATAFTTSAALTEWNFGTIPQRLSMENWLTIWDRIAGTVIGLPLVAFLPVALWAAARSGARLFWITVVLTSILPIVTFFNLYLVHDYYLAAISPSIAALVGLGVARVAEMGSARWWRRTVAVVVTVALGVAAVVAAPYWTRMFGAPADPFNDLPVAAELAAVSRDDELVLVVGRDWSPVPFYYSRRRGLALSSYVLGTKTALNLPGQGYRVLASYDPTMDPLWVLREWRWVGVAGPHTYLLGDDLESVSQASLIGSSAAPPPGPGKTRSLLNDPRSISCDGKAALELGDVAGRLVLSFRPDVNDQPRIILADGLAPLPVMPFVIYRGAGDGSSLALRCIGGTTVTVLTAETSGG